jgi:hypothetical protein
VRVEFRLTGGQIDDIREKLKTLPKYEPVLLIEVKDDAGVVIAEVDKILHVRKRETARTERQDGEIKQATPPRVGSG